MNHLPTLDPERTEQLRTFLATEAAATAASPAHPSNRTRLVLGVAAALLLGGALTIGSSFRDDGSAPAAAVAIEQADGWTTIRLNDICADPEAVVDELSAAGVEARVGDPAELGMEDGGGTAFAVEATDGSWGTGMSSAPAGMPAPDDASPSEGCAADQDAPADGALTSEDLEVLESLDAEVREYCAAEWDYYEYWVDGTLSPEERGALDDLPDGIVPPDILEVLEAMPEGPVAAEAVSDAVAEIVAARPSEAIDPGTMAEEELGAEAGDVPSRPNCPVPAFVRDAPLAGAGFTPLPQDPLVRIGGDDGLELSIHADADVRVVVYRA